MVYLQMQLNGVRSKEEAREKVGRCKGVVRFLVYVYVCIHRFNVLYMCAGASGVEEAAGEGADRGRGEPDIGQEQQRGMYVCMYVCVANKCSSHYVCVCR